ncbi:MAG: hypothetical protein H7Z42_05110 [Roseiflexaceae bacterium]|nr:hypothetical protein [Roseiflexaceae bacterium]
MKLKIINHPRMRDVVVGDQVYCHPRHIFAHVVETFPSAVCVRVGTLTIKRTMELVLAPQLWPADEIENLSVCRFCGSRDGLHDEAATGVPSRICADCLAEDSRR